MQIARVATRKVAVLSNANTVAFTETRLRPELEPEYVRLRVHSCGICGTDLAYFRQKRPVQYPMSFGHEYCGTVEGVGGAVTQYNVGDFVGVDPNYRCGECIWCFSHKSHLCAKGTQQLFSNRGLSSHVDLHEKYLFHLPHLPQAYLGALVEPLSCAFHAIGLVQGHSVNSALILGAGGMGVLIAAVIQETMTHWDVSLHDTYNPRLKNAVACLRCNEVPTDVKTPPRLFDVVFDATGDHDGLACAAKYVNNAGEIVVVTRVDHVDEIALPVRRLQRAEVSIRWSHLNGDGACVEKAIRFVSSSWKQQLYGLLDHAPLQDLPAILSVFDRRRRNKVIIHCSA